jgi:hypothetical protein
VRDYIHVVDLADGHIAALRKLYEDSDKIGKQGRFLLLYHWALAPVVVNSNLHRSMNLLFVYFFSSKQLSMLMMQC